MKLNLKESLIKKMCQVFNKKYIEVGEIYPDNTTFWVFGDGIPRAITLKENKEEYRRENDELPEEIAEIFGYTTKDVFYPEKD